MDEDAHRRWHVSFLPSTVLGYSGEPRLLDSYYRYVTHGIYAFSARLTFAEIEDLAKKPGCTTCEAAAWDCGALPLVSKPPAMSNANKG
ncbi:hypothetical protein DAI22_08g117300 [Oryza sativa Japonica Group]|nr:hypothetical protein DAI22_08g117300 [Oryza sativa Japonica Group]